jgi:ketosteroid isomerase-like protein
MTGDAAKAREIEETIREMNHCWTESWNEEEFRNYIHEDAVAVVPTTPGRLEGRDAYVAGWRNFVLMARVLEWRETGYRVQLYCAGTCAVVTYLFTIRFSAAGVVQEMRGRDMLFVVNEQGRWQVVADQFSPEPPV